MPDTPTRSIGDPARSRRALRAVAQVIPALVLLAVLMPGAATGYSIVDDSWVAVLHDSFAAERRFGDEIVFTFGPLGFMFAGIDARTLPADVVLWTLLAGLYVVVLIGVSRPDRSLAGAMAIQAAVVAALALSRGDPRILFGPIALAIVMLPEVDDGPTRRARIAAGAAAAITSLIKFSCFVAAVPVLLVGIALDVARRRVPLAGVSFVASLVVFWIGAGQRLTDMPAWVANSLRIVSGYTPVMTTIEGPGAIALAGFFVPALLLIAVSLGMSRDKGRLSWVLPGVAVAWIVFALSKATFVRYDAEHVATGPVGLVLLAVGLVSISRRRGTGRMRVLSATALVIAAAAAWSPVSRSLGGNPVAHLLQPSGGPEEHGEAGESPTGLPLLTDTIESVDLYSVGHRALFETGITYRPRPVFQSYSAYTRPLLEMNARHLESSRAAETLLIRPGTIDGRFPTFDDSLSYPALMSLYEVAGRRDGWLRLDRRAVPVDLAYGETDERSASLGQLVSLPDTGHALWAEIDVSPTLAGRLLSSAYRAPALYLIAERADGNLAVHRFHPAMASAGFLLSPLVDSAGMMEQVFLGAPVPEARVRAIMIRPDDPADIGRFWDPAYRIRLRTIQVPSSRTDANP